MDDDRKSSLPPPSEIDAMCDDDKMPDEAETTPETSGARTETPEVGETNALMHETMGGCGRKRKRQGAEAAACGGGES